MRKRTVALAVCAAMYVVADGDNITLEAQKAAATPRYTFTIQIDGLAAAGYTEVSGIAIETEVTELREGGSNDVRKLPGRTKFSNVTLRRGYTGNHDLYDWAASNVTGKLVRRNVSITISDVKGTVVAKWNLSRAWPVKWQPPALNASGNDVAIETVELAHEGLTVSGGK
jgi:phage tail-like protein